MKKLEDYKEQKIAIRCKTDDEIRAILKLNNSVLNTDRLFDYLKTKGDGYKFCYRISDGYSYEDFYINQGCTIIPATDFLEEEFVYGQEYEFSDDEEFRNSEILIFGCENPIDKSGYKYIAFTKNGFPYNFKHARKINTERTEAITTIKELVSKFSINQNEVF